MIKVHRYRDAGALALGLGNLRLTGLTPRGLLFLALDAKGEIHLAVPEDILQVTRIRVGDKLSLAPPWSEPLFHFDSIHRLPAGGVLWNGDRRLAHPGDATDVATVVAEWLKGSGARNVFLGCTPHQPGSWFLADDKVAALHERGFVDVVTTATGLLARRMGEGHLYYLSQAKLVLVGPLFAWTPVYESSLGRILLLERRVKADRLTLTCEHGLVEVDVSALPHVAECVAVPLESGLGVVGRMDGGAFAVTCGVKEEWGLRDVAPALLVGAKGDTLVELAQSLRAS
ncbi:MAG TPA: hypothetical protein VKE22_23555 [Haliangiales bacterium]|nr:hypothetical protein [Haliangiales bacterium]